ncbi:MAG: AAA family ATPase [Rhodospirillaceae bacterium]
MSTRDQDSLPESASGSMGNNVRASWNVSLDQLRQNIDHNNDKAKDALIGAFRWCIDPAHPVSRYEFAHATGINENTLYKIIAGKHVHPDTKERLPLSGKFVKAVNEWLELQAERFSGGSADFVLTPTARKIHNGCDLARESQTPVIVWGPSHIGKTWALEEYTHSNNHGRTVYCRMRAASGLGGMVKRIADRLGISAKSNTLDLVDRIKRALTPNMVLILDEIHLLRHTYRVQSFFACLEVIREIHDETRCGMVLCGTQLFLRDMKAGQHEELEQVWRRGVHKLHLPNMPTKADLAAIFRERGLEFPSKKLVVTVTHQAGDQEVRITECPFDVLRQLAKQEGLKSITERVRYGQKLASKSKRKITWTHVMDAHLRIQKQATPEPDWS